MKPKFCCKISMGKYAVNIFSDKLDFLPSLKEKGSFIPFIPEWKCDNTMKPDTPALIYQSGAKTRLKFSLGRGACILQGPIRYFKDGQTIAYLAYALLERERQINSETTIHAAGASYKGRGILLLGERGAGKTSLLLKLCRDYGYKLVGNDLCLLKFDKNVIKFCGGTKIFGLRQFAVKINHPDLLQYFPKFTKDSWLTKSFITPETLSVDIEKQTLPIYKVFFIHLDSTGEEPIYSEYMTGSWIKCFLYENLSRYIRGSAIIPFLDNQNFRKIGYLPSLDEPNFHKKRVAIINHLIDKIRVRYVSGSHVGTMSKCIHSIVNAGPKLKKASHF
jgi:hypothetical protein